MTATSVKVDPAAYQQMLHELRQYRDAAQAPHTLPELRLRKGVITARDPATYTCTVNFGAADTSDFPGDPVAGIRLADTVYPMVGAACFVAFSGPDPTVLYTVEVGVGRCRAWRDTASSFASGAITAIPLNIDSGSGMHDTDSMHTSSDSQLYCHWPGHYQAHGCVRWNPLAATGFRAICDLRLTRAAGGTPVIARTEDRPMVASQDLVQEATAADFVMAAGDYLELAATQLSGSPNSVVSTAEFSPILELTWTGPPT